MQRYQPGDMVRIICSDYEQDRGKPHWPNYASDMLGLYLMTAMIKSIDPCRNDAGEIVAYRYTIVDPRPNMVRAWTMMEHWLEIADVDKRLAQLRDANLAAIFGG